MEYVAKPTPASDFCTNALGLNLAIVDKLNELIEQCNTRIGKIRERKAEIHRELEMQNSYPSTTQMIKESKLWKVPVLLFLPPYFRDSTNEQFSCPPFGQQVTSAICSPDFFDALVEPTKTWLETEKRKLSEAAMKGIVSAHTAGLRSKISHLEAQVAALNVRSDNGPKKRGRKRKMEQPPIPLNDDEQREFADLKERLELCYEELDSTKYSEELETSLGYNQMWNVMCEISVAVFKGTRSVRECLLMWKNALKPSISQKEWSTKEIAKLRRANPYRTDWDKFAQKLGTHRTALQCFQMCLENSTVVSESD